MNEITVTHAILCDDQTEAPPDFKIWLGIDQAATTERGMMVVIAFPVPDEISMLLHDVATHETRFNIVVKDALEYHEQFLGLDCLYIQVMPFAVGVHF